MEPSSFSSIGAITAEGSAAVSQDPASHFHDVEDNERRPLLGLDRDYSTNSYKKGQKKLRKERPKLLRYLDHGCCLQAWLANTTSIQIQGIDNRRQPRFPQNGSPWLGARQQVRNVENNIQRPVYGSNYDDSTPWHQHNNSIIRNTVILMRWLWSSCKALFFNTWQAIFNVAIFFLRNLFHPMTVFLAIYLVIAIFIGKFVLRGEFPALLLAAGGFLTVMLAIFGAIRSQ